MKVVISMKRLLFFVAFAICIMSLKLNVNAAGVLKSSGKCGDSAKYYIYDTDGNGTGDRLEIKGSGMAYYDRLPSLNNIKVIETDENVDFYSVGNYGVFEAESLEEIVIKGKITNFGFAGCKNLRRVILPLNKSGLLIMNNTFAGCEKLEYIELPELTTCIQPNAFKDCPSNLTIGAIENTYGHRFALRKGYNYKRLEKNWIDEGSSDTISPIATEIEVLNEGGIVTRPGVLHLKVYFYEEGTGIESIEVSFYDENNNEIEGYKECNGEFTGYVLMDIPISSTAKTGRYSFSGHINISDSVHNCAGSYQYAFETSFTVVDEFDIAFETSLTNPNLANRISSMQDGKTVRILNNGNNGIISKEALDAIAGTNKRIVCYDDKMQWIFDGKEMIGTTKDLDLDASISMVTDDKYGGNGSKQSVKIDFADNGLLPGVTHIRLKSDYLYSQYGISGNLYLYAIDANGTSLESQDNPGIEVVFDGTDKWVYFDVTHNSSYLISAQKFNNAIACKHNWIIKNGNYYCDKCGKTKNIQLVQSFVERLYTDCLGRPAEESGRDFWTNELCVEKVDGASVGASFVFSEEYSNKGVTRKEYVTMLYKVFMNREADEGGLNYWIDNMKNGMSREEVFKKFVYSEEYTKICANYGILRGEYVIQGFPDPVVKNGVVTPEITSYVERIYEKALNRTSDPDGIDYWSHEIANEAKSPVWVAELFIFSEEFENKKLDDTEYVKVLYRTFMGREFDEAGLNYWLGQLTSGKTRKEVLEAFAGCPEFQEIIKSFGL